MNQVININGRAVERIEYKGSAVTTLPMIDDLHERQSGHARKTFNRHKERMIEGKHFFLVPQSEWKPLFSVHETDAEKENRRYAGEMYLLTQIGYAKLVKVFDDDLAWEIYELMVDSYFGFSEKTAPDKRIGIEHTRGTNAPNGLDIRYNLDLTKIITNPTHKAIMLLSRLTGIDLEDIAAMPNELSLLTDQAMNQAEVKTFLTEACFADPGASISATALYNVFTAWSKNRYPERRPLSQKAFGAVATSLNLKRHKGEKSLVEYQDLGYATLKA